MTKEIYTNLTKKLLSELKAKIELTLSIFLVTNASTLLDRLNYAESMREEMKSWSIDKTTEIFYDEGSEEEAESCHSLSLYFVQKMYEKMLDICYADIKSDNNL